MHTCCKYTQKIDVYVCVCMCMYVHVYTYVEIYSGYVKCSDKNLAELRTKLRSLKASPRGTCFHSLEVHHLLCTKQFYLPSASTLPPLTATAINFSVTLLQYLFALVPTYAQRRLI